MSLVAAKPVFAAVAGRTAIGLTAGCAFLYMEGANIEVRAEKFEGACPDFNRSKRFPDKLNVRNVFVRRPTALAYSLWNAHFHLSQSATALLNGPDSPVSGRNWYLVDVRSFGAVTADSLANPEWPLLKDRD